MAQVRSTPSGDQWQLRLYVAGRSPNSVAALLNLRRLCDELVHGEYRIEVVDLLSNPDLAKADGVLAVPTLVRTCPSPVRKVVGVLSDSGQTIAALGLRLRSQ